MAGTLGKILGLIVRRSGATVAGLVQGQTGAAITQDSLSSISYQVVRLDNAGVETITGSGTLTISAVVFDTAQTTDPRYTISGGYNFLAVIPASCFQTGGRTHRIEVTFVPVTGEPFVQEWQGETI